jgi:antirestriction protein ArdC
MSTDIKDPFAGMSKFRKELAQNIIEAVKNNQAPWQKQWNAGELSASHNGKTGNKYKGINALNLSMIEGAKGYDRSDWYTYNQSQEIGAQVRKGEKGAQIELWKFTETQDERDANGNLVMGPNGKPNKVEVKLDSPRVMYFTVFNGSQLDNAPEIVKDIETRKVEALEQGEKLVNAISQNMGVPISHGGDKAYYRQSSDTIQMPQRDAFIDAGAYYGTALHELAHATGHESRLDRKIGNKFGTPDYAKEELRAEIASWMLSAETGLPHDPSNHAAYLGSWVKALEQQPGEIFDAMKDANQIVSYMHDMSVEKAIELKQDQQVEQQLGVVQSNELTTERAAPEIEPVNPNAVTEIDVDGIVYKLKPVKAHDIDAVKERWPSARELTGESDRDFAREAVKDSLAWEAARKDINWTVDNAKILSPLMSERDKSGLLTGRVAAETSMAVYLQIASQTVVQLDKTTLFNDKGIQGVAHTGDFMQVQTDERGVNTVKEITREPERKVSIDESFENAKTAAKIELGTQDIGVERVDNEVGTGKAGTYLLETSSHIVVHKPGASEVSIVAKQDLVRNKDQDPPKLGQTLGFEKTESGKMRVSSIDKDQQRTKGLDR